MVKAKTDKEIAKRTKGNRLKDLNKEDNKINETLEDNNKVSDNQMSQVNKIECGMMLDQNINQIHCCLQSNRKVINYLKILNNFHKETNNQVHNHQLHRKSKHKKNQIQLQH